MVWKAKYKRILNGQKEIGTDTGAPWRMYEIGVVMKIGLVAPPGGCTVDH